MNVLSLFDWISCGRIALERAWIKVDKYYASEIDKYAIQVSKKNYPDIIHIWSVTWLIYEDGALFHNQDNNPLVNGWSYIANIDLIIWWSPCQDLSIAKKDRKWLQWEKSWLFFEYVRLLKEVKPKYFLLENVASMKKADKEKITRILWVEPVMINSALVSAQNRKRLYWFWQWNWEKYETIWIEQPVNNGILLKDILEENVDEKYIVDRDTNWYKENNNCFYPLNSVWKLRQGYEIYKDDAKTYSLNCSHAWNTMVRVWQFNSWWQWDRVYSPEWKSVSLSANGGGRGAKTGLYEVPPIIRKLTPIECERLQTLPDNYTEGISNTQRYKTIWNGWTVDVIAHIFSYLK